MKVNLPGIIQIVLPGVTFEETERCRAIIHTLFQNEIFNIRNGKATLHFDHEGTLQQIQVDTTRWRRDKPLTALREPDKLEVQVKTLTETISGPR